MFNIGDKIVCIDNRKLDWILKLNVVYTVSEIDNYEFNHIKIKELGVGWFYNNRFMSLSEIRKQKINNIKERICSTQVIKFTVIIIQNYI